jgi:hypothetical protein
MLFADNVYEINMHRCIYTQQQRFLVNPPPCFRPCFILPLLRDPTLLFTYLEILLLLLMARIPIHSCPWFAINRSPIAAPPTPRHPIDQVTYVHRRHQHQPFCLTQLHMYCTNPLRPIAISFGWFCWKLQGMSTMAKTEFHFFCFKVKWRTTKIIAFEYFWVF